MPNSVVYKECSEQSGSSKNYKVDLKMVLFDTELEKTIFERQLLSDSDNP